MMVRVIASMIGIGLTGLALTSDAAPTDDVITEEAAVVFEGTSGSADRRSNAPNTYFDFSTNSELHNCSGVVARLSDDCLDWWLFELNAALTDVRLEKMVRKVRRMGSETSSSSGTARGLQHR